MIFMSEVKQPFVSVIIPAYKDWERLSLCLNALAVQTYPQESFEVIIANNKPGDVPPASLVLQPNTLVITEAKPGSYAARNTAIGVAKGEILAFTDSDCIPDADWLKNAVAFFNSNPQYSRIGGRVQVFFASTQLTNAELYDKIYAFRQKEVVETRGTCVTANLITYKSVFDKAGLFNDELLSGGDFEWGKRADAAGFKIGYGADVVVNHPARVKMKELIKKSRRVAGGHAMVEMPVKTSKAKLFLRYLKSALRPPLNQIAVINEHKHDMSALQRTTVFMIIYYLKAVMAVEKYRIQTGKKANRA